MSDYKEKIADFLTAKAIAVTGVSSGGTAPANAIFQRFREKGYRVYAINPSAEQVEGVQAYPSLSAVKDKIGSVLIASPPASALRIINECLELNISRVWFHSSVDKGSLDEEAARYAEENSMTVIRTGCPLMYVEPVDLGHKCIKWILHLTGKIPLK